MVIWRTVLALLLTLLNSDELDEICSLVLCLHVGFVDVARGGCSMMTDGAVLAGCTFRSLS